MSEINIYQSLPKQLNRENIKFKYKIISEYANKRDYDLPITWLTSSGIVLKSNSLDNINVPLSAGEDVNNVRNKQWDKVSVWNIENKTLGIVGIGNIGSHITKILHDGFGMVLSTIIL